MEEAVPGSTFPWSWVIEALAKSQVVDATLLHELVSKVPPLLGDSGKEAREATALRCLEGLCGPLNVSSENHVVTEQLKIGLDPAESCEVALQRILSETSGFKGVSNDLKSDVLSFVKHKKANFPKSTLELLKDMILEGTHPLAASLREMSGFSGRDQRALNIHFDSDDPTSTPLRRDEDNNGDTTMLADDNACYRRSDMDKQPGQPDFPNGMSLLCKGGVSSFSTDSHMKETNVTSYDINDQRRPGKKFKLDQSKQQHTGFAGNNQMCNGTEDGQYPEVIKTNVIHDGKSLGKDVDEQAKTSEEIHDRQQIPPTNGHHGEGIDFAMKNPNFLSSHCAFPGDSLVMTETEANLCMKCNKDGHLLSCSASSCLLLVHKNCLGCSAYYDDHGNFYCPFCVYSHAIAEYARAKEKVSLARKEISLFIGGRSDDLPEHDADTSSGDDANQVRHMNVDKTAELKEGSNVGTQAAKPLQRILKGKQLELSHASACMDVNGFVMATQQQLSFEDRLGARITIQLSADPSQNWNQEQDGHGCGGALLSSNNDLKIQGETTRCKITELHGDNSSESISDSDGLQEDTRNDASIPLASPQPLRAIPGTPRCRRKKVPWTAEEEATLKKGVEKYQGGSRAIPWKSILEYGGSVFQKERTAIDLKDKWRNIMRGTSPKVK